MLGTTTLIPPRSIRCHVALPRPSGVQRQEKASRGRSRQEESFRLSNREQLLDWKSGFASGLVFAALAYDIFHPSSLGLLAPVDQELHHLALSLDPSVSNFFVKEVSDSAILCGWLAWLAVTLVHLGQVSVLLQVPVSKEGQDDKEAYLRASLIICISWVFFTMMAGDHQPWLIGSLKDFFERERPSPVLSSFSFPSGHTAASTFLALNFMTVLLPTVIPRLSEDSKKLAGPVILSAYTITATGRILGNAHWFSDTLASLFLSLTVVSLINELRNFIQRADRS